MFLSSSLDILYLVLALSALLVAIYLSYALYQISRTLRNVNRLFEAAMEKMEMVVNAVTYMKDKMEAMTSGFGVIGEVLSGILRRLVSSYLGEGEEKPRKKK